MYEHRRSRIPVREGTRSYAAPDADGFPAGEVLWDLRLATGPNGARRAERVLARYAALRHWLLRQEGAPVAVVRHARAAAGAHVTHCRRVVAPHVWHEGELLRRLLEADLAQAMFLLAEAAVEAEAAGDADGAAALLAAARDALRRLGGQGRSDLN